MSWDGMVSIDDLSLRQREMAETIGMETFIKLTQCFGGERPYIPKFDELIKDPRNREIREKYNGYNTLELAREYRLSERYVRQLTQDIRQDRQSLPIEGQTTLFSE